MENNTERYKLSLRKLYRNPPKTTGHRQTVSDVNCIWVYQGTDGTAEEAKWLRRPSATGSTDWWPRRTRASPFVGNPIDSSALRFSENWPCSWKRKESNRTFSTQSTISHFDKKKKKRNKTHNFQDLLFHLIDAAVLSKKREKAWGCGARNLRKEAAKWLKVEKYWVWVNAISSAECRKWREATNTQPEFN